MELQSGRQMGSALVSGSLQSAAKALREVITLSEHDGQVSKGDKVYVWEPSGRQ